MQNAVWDYTTGRYQVLKKCLSYRERQVLACDVRGDDARKFTYTVRGIAALLLLTPSPDRNYVAIKTNCYPWMAD